MNTTESKAIRQLIRFVDGKSATNCVASYDGNLLFYEKGMLKGDISFTYSGAVCNRFVRIADGQTISTELSKEAGDFLRSLAEGKGWY